MANFFKRAESFGGFVAEIITYIICIGINIINLIFVASVDSGLGLLFLGWFIFPFAVFTILTSILLFVKSMIPRFNVWWLFVSLANLGFTIYTTIKVMNLLNLF